MPPILVFALFTLSFVTGVGTPETGAIEKVVLETGAIEKVALVALIAGCIFIADADVAVVELDRERSVVRAIMRLTGQIEPLWFLALHAQVDPALI